MKSEIKHNLLRNKKGDERYLSPWLFLVWALIAVFIVAGVWIFYSAEVDIRAEESEVLSMRILDCLVDNGEINQIVFQENFDIFSECSLNKEILKESREFYFNISLKDLNGKILKSISAGEKDFEIQCRLKGKNFALCSEKKVYVGRDKENLIMEILAGSNQQGAKI